MHKKLYLIQNLMIFMEECFVTLPDDNDFYTINPYYVKNNNTFKALKHDIELLFPNLKYITYSEIYESSWNRMLISSYAPEELLHEINQLDVKDITLVEDGLFDYISTNAPYPFYNDKPLYLFRPQLASLSAQKAVLKAFNVTDNVINRFNSVFSTEIKKLSELDPKTLVLFTTPLGEDFGSDSTITNEIMQYIEKTFGPKKIVLKKHPRDSFAYTSDSIEIIECNQNIPGQLLDRIFDGLKVFLFPSTVSFMCGELSDIVFLNALPNNNEYCKAFNAITDSDLFNIQKHIKKLTL